MTTAARERAEQQLQLLTKAAALQPLPQNGVRADLQNQRSIREFFKSEAKAAPSTATPEPEPAIDLTIEVRRVGQMCSSGF